MIAALITGCASGGSGDGGKVTIRFNWWGSDSRHVLTQKAIDLFEQAHPTIDVQPEFSNFADYFDKLSTGAASNDMFLIGQRYLVKGIATTGLK